MQQSSAFASRAFHESQAQRTRKNLQNKYLCRQIGVELLWKTLKVRSKDLQPESLSSFKLQTLNIVQHIFLIYFISFSLDPGGSGAHNRTELEKPSVEVFSSCCSDGFFNKGFYLFSSKWCQRPSASSLLLVQLFSAVA